MDFEKLTDRSKELMQDVINLAAANRNQYITPLHLLKVLLDDKNDLIVNLILKAGGSITQIRNKVETAFAKLPQVAGSGVQSLMSQDFTMVMMEAEKLADKSGDRFVTIERIFQALSMTSGNEAYDILTASGVNAVKLNQVINEYRKGRIADSESAEDNFEALKKFTIDITQKAQIVERTVLLVDKCRLDADDFYVEELAEASHPCTLEDMERQFIAEVLKEKKGNLTLAAQQLDISRQTLYNKMRKYGL